MANPVAPVRPSMSYMVLSPNQHMLLVIAPPSRQPDPGTGQPSTGKVTAYRLMPGGELQVFWRAKGWFAEKALIANDGFHVVQVGEIFPVSNDAEKQPDSERENIAVLAFYDKGLLLKRYTVDQLVKDRTRMKPNLGPRFWLADASEPTSSQPVIKDDTSLELETCDGLHYTFDLATGEIKTADHH